VFRRVVPLVKHHCRFHLLVADVFESLLQSFDDRQELFGVRLIPRIQIMKERNVEVGRHHHGEADDLQIASFLLAVDTLRERTIRFRVNVREEVRCIVDQSIQAQAIGLHDGAGKDAM